MANQSEGVIVTTLDAYSPEVTAGINALMPQLDDGFVGSLTTEHFERFFKNNDERDILVARLGKVGKVIGSAVMMMLVEQTPDSLGGYLGGFVVDSQTRRSGAGRELWAGMLNWCRERGLSNFSFNTETWRPDAIAFYERMGAQLVDGTDSHYTVPVPSVELPGAILIDVMAAFYGGAHTKLDRLGEGLVNDTLLATNDHKSVLQRLNGVFEDAVVADSDAIAKHMTAKGWEVPQTVPTRAGALVFRDAYKRAWRQLSFIESDGAIPEAPDMTTLYKVGSLLGEWHADLAELAYEPTFAIPHFHDTTHHLSQLGELQASMPDAPTQTLAMDILDAYANLAPLPELEPQLIHGDPQLTNILFRDGMPYTYIDLDTTMKGPVWLDIGDLLRATLEDDLKAGRSLQPENLVPIIDGYYAAAKPPMTRDEFFKGSIGAAQQIALELAARFMNDIVGYARTSDSYFAWDDQQFASQRDNHMFRAGMQLQIYRTLEDTVV